MARPQVGALPADPTPIAFGDTVSKGVAGDNAALATHRHAAPANPVTAHESTGQHSVLELPLNGGVGAPAAGEVQFSAIADVVLVGSVVNDPSVVTFLPAGADPAYALMESQAADPGAPVRPTALWYDTDGEVPPASTSPALRVFMYQSFT